MSEFRIVMKTRDDFLIANRKANKDFLFIARGRPDKEFIEYTLKRDCAEKGVKLLEYKVEEDGIHAIVDWF